MRLIEDVIKGAIKINGNLDRQCFSSWREFLETLPNLLAVEVPRGASSLLVGREEPGEEDRNKLWARQDSNGAFLGLYAFQNGGWRPFYNYVQNEIIWMFGNSDTIPDGFTLVEVGDPVIPSSVVNAIRGQFIPGANNNFIYFAVKYTGF